MATHCEQVQGLLPEYQEGGLTPSERGRVDRHLSGCPECRGVLRGLRESWERLRAWPDREPAPDYRLRFWRRVGEEEARCRPGWGWLFARRPWLAPVGLATLLVISFVSGALWSPKARGAGPPRVVVRAAKPAPPSAVVEELPLASLGLEGPLEFPPDLLEEPEIGLAGTSPGRVDAPLSEEMLERAVAAVTTYP